MIFSILLSFSSFSTYVDCQETYKRFDLNDVIMRILEQRMQNQGSSLSTVYFNVDEQFCISDYGCGFYWKPSNSTKCRISIARTRNIKFLAFRGEVSEDIYWHCPAGYDCFQLGCTSKSDKLFIILLVFPLLGLMLCCILYFEFEPYIQFCSNVIRFKIFQIRIRLSKNGRVLVNNLDEFLLAQVVKKMPLMSAREFAMCNRRALQTADRMNIPNFYVSKGKLSTLMRPIPVQK